MCDNGATLIQDERYYETQSVNQDFKKTNFKSSSSNSFLSRLAMAFGGSVLAVFICLQTYQTIEAINEPVRSLNKDYEWPQVSDFLHILWQLPIVIVIYALNLAL
jgi:hypothetical protein